MNDSASDIPPRAPIEWEYSDSFVDYDEAVQRMETRVQAIREGRRAELVWLLQHPPLYTAGTSAKMMDLLDADRFPVYLTGRGGEYTYHGPGQRVVYVMLDLKPRGGDVRGYVHALEQWAIDALRDFGVKAERRADRIGVWVVHDNGREEKVAAVGVRVRKWVTYHGIAINVSPDLSHYSGIVPCGISEHGVTSLEALGVDVNMDDVDAALRRHFDAHFALPEASGAA